MMKRLSNKKGIYSFILTKTVMLVFILGLVSIFYNLYANLNVRSAEEIAVLEANRIAKEIDDAIGFKGISNTITLHLNRNLNVGKETVPYSFEITKEGNVVLRFLQYPYSEIFGVSRFGLKMELKEGSPKERVFCNWKQIQNGVSITITKESHYQYDNVREKLIYSILLKIDAEDCLHYMELEEDFEE